MAAANILAAGSGTKRIKEALQEAASFLTSRGVGGGRVEAELLLSILLGVKRTFLYAHGETALSGAQLAAYAGLCQRRASGEPLAYISGEKEFMGLTFYVERGVFIPRPETEHLVERVLRWAREKEGSASDGTGLSILELGTGSGNIAVCLAHFLPGVSLVAVDAEAKALEVARRNSRRHGVTPRITFLQGNYYDALDALAGISKGFNAIVANPPYVEEPLLPGLSPEVQQEPRRALCGGFDGLDAYREIVAKAPGFLLSPGLLALELGAGQAEQVRGLAHRAGFFSTAVYKDYGGIERVLLAYI